MYELAEELKQAIVYGDIKSVESLAFRLFESNSEIRQVVIDAIMSAMDCVGQSFERGEVFIPELVLAGRAAQICMDRCRSLLSDSWQGPSAKVIIGTVKGDIHDLGKNTVGMMLRGAGFEVIDLGVDVSPVDFVAAVRATGALVVGLSALLDTTVGQMDVVIKTLEESGQRHQVRVVVGGRPVTAIFAKHIGADGYASNAVEAVRLVRYLVGENRAHRGASPKTKR